MYVHASPSVSKEPRDDNLAIRLPAELSKRRPQSFAQLAAKVPILTLGSPRFLKAFLITTSELKSRGHQQRDSDNLENAFINYARATTIAFEHTPQNHNYLDLSFLDLVTFAAATVATRPQYHVAHITCLLLHLPPYTSTSQFRSQH